MIKKVVMLLCCLIVIGCAGVSQPAEDIVYDEIKMRMDQKGEKLFAEILGVNALMARMAYDSDETKPTAATEKKCKKIIRDALNGQKIENSYDAEEWLATKSGKKIEHTVQVKIVMDIVRHRLRKAGNTLLN